MPLKIKINIRAANLLTKLVSKISEINAYLLYIPPAIWTPIAWFLSCLHISLKAPLISFLMPILVVSSAAVDDAALC